jgi:hypothetical protein
MTQRILPELILASAVCALAPLAFVAGVASAAPAAKKAAAVPAAPAGTPIEYSELEHRVGDHVIVETTLETVRRGTLIKYTNPTLTLQLGPEHGSIELSVPRETVRSLRIIPAATPAAESTPRQQGDGSAEKN